MGYLTVKPINHRGVIRIDVCFFSDWWFNHLKWVVNRQTWDILGSTTPPKWVWIKIQPHPRKCSFFYFGDVLSYRGCWGCRMKSHSWHHSAEAELDVQLGMAETGPAATWKRLCSGDFPKGNAVVLQRWDRLGTWKHRQLVIFKEWRYSGWWFQTMNCLFSMSYMGYITLPIDELHHFSRWAHCTTSQIENEGISMRLALISPANC